MNWGINWKVTFSPLHLKKSFQNFWFSSLSSSPSSSGVGIHVEVVVVVIVVVVVVIVGVVVRVGNDVDDSVEHDQNKSQEAGNRKAVFAEFATQILICGQCFVAQLCRH